MNSADTYYAKLYFHNRRLFDDKAAAMNVNRMLNICVKCPMLQVLAGKISFFFTLTFITQNCIIIAYNKRRVGIKSRCGKTRMI